MKVIVDKVFTEDNVILEFIPSGYKVLKAFKNIREAKKWIKENQEKVKGLIKEHEKHGRLYLTSVRACYLIDVEGE